MSWPMELKNMKPIIGREEPIGAVTLQRSAVTYSPGGAARTRTPRQALATLHMLAAA